MGQEQLDTKALEVAMTALARIDSHERLCSERYEQLAQGVDDVKNSLQTMNDRQFYLIMSLVGVLLAVVGFFVEHYLIK